MFSEQNKPKRKDLTRHPTKRKVLIKFGVVALVFMGYFLFTAGRYGFQSGFHVAALTWSFFVLCTPIADAGFLLDFPLRLLLGLRMIIAEISVWLIAISFNMVSLLWSSSVYDRTDLLQVFKRIIETPWPFWLIIAISAVGTFMSVSFGDELIDKAQHKQRGIYNKNKFKHRLAVMVFVIVSAAILYDVLLTQLGVRVDT